MDVNHEEPPQQAIERALYPDFEKRLRDRWQDLRSQIRTALMRADDEAFTAVAGEVHDMDDAALADLVVDINNAEVVRDIAEMRNIEAALQRIAVGTYGVCLQCHMPIARERLEAYPMAQRCMRCQRLHERRQGKPPQPKL